MYGEDSAVGITIMWRKEYTNVLHLYVCMPGTASRATQKRVKFSESILVSEITAVVEMTRSKKRRL